MKGLFKMYTRSWHLSGSLTYPFLLTLSKFPALVTQGPTQSGPSLPLRLFSYCFLPWLVLPSHRFSVPGTCQAHYSLESVNLFIPILELKLVLRSTLLVT